MAAPPDRWLTCFFATLRSEERRAPTLALPKYGGGWWAACRLRHGSRFMLSAPAHPVSGMAPLMLMGTVGIFFVPVMVRIFISVYPSTQEGAITKKQTGPVEVCMISHLHAFRGHAFHVTVRQY